MVRWEPDSRERLAQAALALYSERGYANTTVAEIAERAGLTERTFFRHYADKRDVLFAGAAEFEQRVVDAVAAAPSQLSTIDAAAAGVEAAAAMLQDRHEFARRRQRVIAANAELRERELIKLAALSAAVADTLRRRGVEDPAAGLAAEVALAVFKTAYERWIDAANERPFTELVAESLTQLRALTPAG
jgi:AcrR family transcriptional regulator